MPAARRADHPWTGAQGCGGSSRAATPTSGPPPAQSPDRLPRAYYPGRTRQHGSCAHDNRSRAGTLFWITRSRNTVIRFLALLVASTVVAAPAQMGAFTVDDL